MKARGKAIFGAAGLAFALALAPSARAADTLTVCLDEGIPIYSVHHGQESKGFDLAVAQAVAKRLGRALKIQWFESKLDEDASTTLAANALLSDGRCELVGGYPLLGDALGKPGAPTARMPDFDGAKPDDRRRRVALGTLVPSKPYHYAPLTVVLGGRAAAKQIFSLADLDGVKIGVESGTLADAILMVFDDGRLVNRITHLVPGRSKLLARMEAGDFDATLIDLRRYDAYRAAHPDTKLKLSGYYHRIGFNMGFVGLSTEAGLIGQVNQAIADMQAKGEFASLADAAGMTYVPPRQPDVLEHLSLADIYRN